MGTDPAVTVECWVDLNGRLDEVRVSSVARSSNWLWATWQNIASNSTFNSYGPATVVASNLVPMLTSVTDLSGRVGISLSVTNTASDPDVPFSWVDAGATTFPMRFYRVLLGP